MTDWTEQTDQARTWFESLRDRICAEFEAIEREAGSETEFTYTPWDREEAGNDDPGGGVQGLMKGKVFEKVGVNVSTCAAVSRPSLPARLTARVPTSPVSPPPASAWSRTWRTRMCPPCT